MKPLISKGLVIPGLREAESPEFITTDRDYGCRARELRSRPRMTSRLNLQRGGRWLKATLIQCAWGAIQVRDSYPRALYHRLLRRHGKKPAIVAVAAALLTAIYHMLRTDQDYRDLGPAHFTDAASRVQISRASERRSRRR